MSMNDDPFARWQASRRQLPVRASPPIAPMRMQERETPRAHSPLARAVIIIGILAAIGFVFARIGPKLLGF
jgi:hypothetical protein